MEVSSRLIHLKATPPCGIHTISLVHGVDGIQIELPILLVFLFCKYNCNFIFNTCVISYPTCFSCHLSINGCFKIYLLKTTVSSCESLLFAFIVFKTLSDLYTENKFVHLHFDDFVRNCIFFFNDNVIMSNWQKNPK